VAVPVLIVPDLVQLGGDGPGAARSGPLPIPGGRLIADGQEELGPLRQLALGVQLGHQGRPARLYNCTTQTRFFFSHILLIKKI